MFALLLFPLCLAAGVCWFGFQIIKLGVYVLIFAAALLGATIKHFERQRLR